MNKLKQNLHRVLSAILAVSMLASCGSTAFAAQQNSYHDPAEHWLESASRMNELDGNAIVTHETMACGECLRETMFTCFRTPEYSRTGESALNRNVRYSDGTMYSGTGKGNVDAGIPKKGGYYTGHHWAKAVCDVCGTVNSNMNKQTDYGYGKNVYWVYDCAAAFMQELPETVTYEYADNKYHTKKTETGDYCGFCYGTHKTELSELEHHDLEKKVTSQLSNQRFVLKESCKMCDYERNDFVTAKSVVANYYGIADGQPHTVTVTDLSDSDVHTEIRYGNSADSCTLATAPNYTEAGEYPVYYQITYTCNGTEMVENGVAYVMLRKDGATNPDGSCSCGCGTPDCGCQDPSCGGSNCGCKKDTNCNGGEHKYIQLDSTKATCKELGFDRFVCKDCGKIEKRNYVNALDHAWQRVQVREATCETDGKEIEICSRCGEVKTTNTPKGEHKWATHSVKATCTGAGYTVKECEICGERNITDITAALDHNYKTSVTPATCESGGHTTHLCEKCGSSFVTDYTNALDHRWDKGTVVSNSTCNGAGVTEFKCTRCGAKRIEGNAAEGHTPGEAATCTKPQLCTKCGAVLADATGHNFKKDVTDATCTEMGFTTYTCENCKISYKSDYMKQL